MTNLNAFVFNAASAMPTDRKRLARRILRAASQRGALLAGVECDDLDADDLAEILPPEVWWTIHNDGKARDGLLLAGRRDRTNIRFSHVATRYLPGADASPVNAARDLLVTRVEVDTRWSFTAGVLHVPRPVEGGLEAHRQMLAASRKVGADVLFGDFNIGRVPMRKAYPGRTIRSAGVLHAAAVDRFALAAPSRFDLLPGETGDDHKGLKVSIHPKQRRR